MTNKENTFTLDKDQNGTYHMHVKVILQSLMGSYTTAHAFVLVQITLKTQVIRTVFLERKFQMANQNLLLITR